MKKNLRRFLTGVVVMTSVFVLSTASLFAATTKVTADECRVRQSASTSAEVAFTVKRGTELEILSKTEPGDGYTWYEVKNGGDTGFIRSDLVEAPSGDDAASDPAAGTSEGSAGDESSPSSSTSASQAIAGVVSADTVTVRSGASTSTSKAGSAKSGQEVSITGEAMDADGYTWYQVSFVADDKGIEGFIRSDFLEVTQFAEPEEEVAEVAEEPEEVSAAPAPTYSDDYEVVYEANSEGVDEWFLYDHIKGTKQSINNIYAVMQQSQQYADEDNSKIGVLKIVIIVMAVLLIGLIVAVVILLLKLRDNYEDYGEMDESEYEDDYEEESYEDEEDDEEEEYERPKRRLGFGGKKNRRAKRSYDFDEDDEDDEEEYVKPSRRSSRSSDSDDAWSTSGMLDIDDDMEFEFLDIDN